MRQTDQNLPFLFPGTRLTGERNLAYAAIHPFPLPGWSPNEPFHVSGPNWQVAFNPNGSDYLEMERGKIADRHLDGPALMIRGRLELSDPVETANRQKPVVDAIRGLFLLFGPPAKPVLLPAVWEGILRKTSPETVAYEVARREATWLGLKKEELEAWGKEWQSFDPLRVPPEISFALRWFYKGMMDLAELSGERVDAFTALWLSVITVVRAWHSQNVGGDPSEVDRFMGYAERRLGLRSDVFDTAVLEFKEIYRRRNALFKGGGGMSVSEQELLALANLAHRLLRFELRQLNSAA